MTVGEVCTYLQGRAPFETAEEYDNVGLLGRSPDMPACRILVTLDITPAAVRAAEEAGADLIVSHHPVIFSPLKRLDTGSIPYRLAGAGIAAICVHTNLDRAAGGVGDLLAVRLELDDIQTAADGICRIGRPTEPRSPRDFAAFVGKRLGTPSGCGRGPARQTCRGLRRRGWRFSAPPPERRRRGHRGDGGTQAS